jgi:predicted O-methyltransferase YrrM
MIGRYISEHSGGMVTISPETGDTRGYLCFDAGGVEVEAGELLYGLVRAMKPERILETGTRLGAAAAYIGLALEENGRGMLTTIEINPDYVQSARTLMRRLGVSEYVQCIAGDACLYRPSEPVDMLFLDTELQFRFADAVRLWPWLKPSGLLIIHDLHAHMEQLSIGTYGAMPDAMRSWIVTGQLQSLHIETPRGLYVGQRTGPMFHSTKVLRGVA